MVRVGSHGQGNHSSHGRRWYLVLDGFDVKLRFKIGRSARGTGAGWSSWPPQTFAPRAAIPDVDIVLADTMIRMNGHLPRPYHNHSRGLNPMAGSGF